jgi:xylulose-5-phosphate/fructose-6-phosphate phosphoketolase
MSANPHTNGGLLLSDLRLPDFRDYAIKVPAPGAAIAESTREMGRFLRDVMKRNLETKNFRLFSPDETTHRWIASRSPTARGRGVELWMTILRRMDGDEMLSEHQCQDARGLPAHRSPRVLSCYEAFIHIIDAMFNQHAKWLKRRTTLSGALSPRSTTCCRAMSGGRTITGSAIRSWSSTTSSTRRRKCASICHLMRTARRLPTTARSRNYVVSGCREATAPQWLTMDEAIRHGTAALASGMGQQ